MWEFIDFAKKFFVKSFIIGYIILLLSALFYIFCFDWMYGLAYKMYGLSKEQFVNAYIFGLTIYKLNLILFFLVPALALFCKCRCEKENKE